MRIFLIIDVDNFLAFMNGAGNRRHIFAYRICFQFLFQQQPANAQVQRHKPAGNRSRARSSVRLNHVAVDADGKVFHFLKVYHGPQRTADKPLNFLRASGRLFGLAGHANLRCPRQHGIFGGNPALVLSLQPGGNFFFHAGRADDMGAAALNQTGTFGIRVEVRNNLNFSDFIF